MPRINAAEAKSPPHEIIPSLEHVRIEIRSTAQDGADCRASGIVQHLVRIQMQLPSISRGDLTDRPVALFTVVHERPLNDFTTQAAGNLVGAIFRAGVYDKDAWTYRQCLAY